MQLLISYLPHLLWIAVLNVESILTLEEDVTSKLFGSLALILLFEVDKGLLSPWNNHDLCYLSLASSGKVDPELFLCSTNREVLDEETEEHDRLLVFEVVHLKLSNSLCLLFLPHVHTDLSALSRAPVSQEERPSSHLVPLDHF